MNEKNAIVDWLDQQQIKNYSINDDLTVDVKGNVDISKRKLTSIPVQFNHVTGYFDCSDNKLTSLKGVPFYLDDDLHINDNELVNLKYSPLKIGGSMYCHRNKLTTLEGCTKIIGAYFACDDNLLTSLKGGPKFVGNDYTASGNKKLFSFEGCPEEVGEDIYFYDCPLCKLDNFTSHFSTVYFSNHIIKGIEKNNTQDVFNYESLQEEKKRINATQLNNDLNKKLSDKETRPKIKI